MDALRNEPREHYYYLEGRDQDLGLLAFTLSAVCGQCGWCGQSLDIGVKSYDT
jgi:hypothetical protein